jgi:hypothetical protein
MKNLLLLILFAGLVQAANSQGNTPVPNNDLETWISYGAYENPQYWDTPNQETSSIPFFGTTVVNKSTDHESGSFSAKLETKSITLVGEIPGVITLGQLTIDISTMSYSISGGVPVYDMPTHLKGFYKFSPKGGDSCAIGIGLLKWNGATRDSIGLGVFSTKDTVPDWTPFSAWIDYDTLIQPDTMNILAISSAVDPPTAGTVLYVDNLYLDYTVAVDEKDPATGIDVYNDRETRRLLLFTDFSTPQSLVVNLYGMTGVLVFSENKGTIDRSWTEVPYSKYSQGVYILEVLHGGQKYVRKYFLGM